MLLEGTDVMDPDYMPQGTAFSLNWSPWHLSKGSRTAVLAYIARNYVGFRKTSVQGDWKNGDTPTLTVERFDADSVCVSLSTDAFVKWEDAVGLDGISQARTGLTEQRFSPKTMKESSVGSLQPRLSSSLSGFPFSGLQSLLSLHTIRRNVVLYTRKKMRP